MVKNCDLGLENDALGLRPGAAFSSPRSQFFTIRASQPANNIFVFTNCSLQRQWIFIEPLRATSSKIAKNNCLSAAVGNQETLLLATLAWREIEGHSKIEKPIRMREKHYPLLVWCILYRPN